MAYLAKKIENAYLVWFEASNQWVQLNEPHWFVFCLYNKNVSRKKAANIFSNKLSTPAEEALQTVDNLYDSLNQLFNPDFSLPQFSENTEKASCFQLPEKKTRTYIYKKKPFKIVYGSPRLERYIHLPLSHLEESFQNENVFTLEVFPFEKRYILRIDELDGKCLSAADSGQIKRLLYVELANYFFEKNDADWLAFIHGSAVKKQNEVVLLTSAGGSGKSTMAGILQLNGFEFFSDDFVPLSVYNNVYPFPAALCLKNNSIQLLSSKGFNFYPKNNKTIAYVKPSQKFSQTKPCKAKNVIFIKYNPNAELKTEKISVLNALSIFLKEAWVGDDMKRAKEFLNWFENLNFFKLEYGNNEKAVKWLTDLTNKV